MGLAAPKNKIKLSHDPNNTKWTSDTTTFGHRILTSQGWTPGQYLGVKGASHAEFHTAANASHIRVVIKDNNLGLGAKLGSGVGHGECTGLDGFQSLLGRLNGKAAEEIEKEEKERGDWRRKGYVERKWGGMRFVRGGVLVGDKIQDLIEGEKERVKKLEGGKRKEGIAESDSSESSEEEEEEQEEKKKSKKRKRAQEEETITDSEVNSKKSKKEREDKKEKKSKKRKSDEEEAQTEESESRKKKSKKDRKSKTTSASTPEESIEESEAARKARKKEKKEKKRKEKEALLATATEAEPEESSSKSSKKKSKSKKDKDKSSNYSSSTSDSSTPPTAMTTTTTKENTPIATSGRSTPMGIHSIRSRHIAQKRMASMDLASLNQIFMIKS